MEQSPKPKWYDRTWLVVLLCIFLFPVGLYAIWKSQRIAIGWKLGYSALIAVALFMPRSESEATTSNAAASSSELIKEAEPTVTPHQRDSIAKADKSTELEERKENTLTAVDLVQHYVNNEVRADGYFKDKRFYVEGTVADIGKDILGKIYVTLEGPANEFRSVQCYFNDPELAAELNKGNTVAFLGTCNGLMMNVLMKDCELVKGTWALEEELASMP